MPLCELQLQKFPLEKETRKRSDAFGAEFHNDIVMDAIAVGNFAELLKPRPSHTCRLKGGKVLRAEAKRSLFIQTYRDKTVQVFTEHFC